MADDHPVLGILEQLEDQFGIKKERLEHQKIQQELLILQNERAKVNQELQDCRQTIQIQQMVIGKLQSNYHTASQFIQSLIPSTNKQLCCQTCLLNQPSSLVYQFDIGFGAIRCLSCSQKFQHASKSNDIRTIPIPPPAGVVS